MVWLAGNLKLEVTNYSRRLYGLEGVVHPSDGDDDGGDGSDEEDSKVTHNYRSRNRRHH